MAASIGGEVSGVAFGLSPEIVVLLGGLALGCLVGAVGGITHYCTMGAISDWVLFGSHRRLRAWALATGAALLGTQGLALLLDLRLDESPYRALPVAWVGAPAGGLLFGIGMVLAGGCAYRNLVRCGGGSLKGLLVVLLMGVAAWLAMGGVLTWPAVALREAAATPSLPSGLDGFLAALGGEAVPWRLALALGLGGGLAVWAIRDVRSRRETLLVGLTLGPAVPVGFLLTGFLSPDPSAPARVESLAFVEPSASMTLWLMTGHGLLPGFGAALALGTVLGAFAAALATGTFRVEGFASTADTGRHLMGAVLMGLGGTVAMGCTVGQGITGVATLSLGACLATGGIVLGAVLTLRYLLHGPSLGFDLPGRHGVRNPKVGAPEAGR